MSAMTEINMTPLIDLAFVLLIIFMITTPLLENKIVLSLPEASQRLQPPPETNFETITINAQRKLFWGEEPVDMNRLNARLHDASLSANPPAIRIRADESLRYQYVIDVIDLVKANGLRKLNLTTKAK